MPTPTHTTVPTVAATPTSDPIAGFAADLRPIFAGDLAAARGLPRYTLQLWLDPDQRVLTGTEQIIFPNTGGAPLEDIVLRLYPNFPRDLFGKGGDVRMDIMGAAVDGRAVAAQYLAQRTAVQLPLNQPLQPGAVARLDLSFTATIVP